MKDDAALGYPGLPGATSQSEAERKYRTALTVLVSGLLWEALVDRGGLKDDVEYLLMLRHLRAVGSAGDSFHSASGPLEPLGPAEEIRARSPQREKSRYELMSRVPLLADFIKLAYRELLRQEGLDQVPSESAENTLLGLPVILLDELLLKMGWDIGSRRRSRLLKELTDDGWIELLRGDRWYKYRVEAPDLTQAEAARYHRFQFLSMLEQTVVHRQVGCPGLLWFVGFIETSEGLEDMRKTMVEGIEAWLAQHRVPLWCVPPGEEDQLVWMRTGLAIGARQAPATRLPSEIEQELLYTIGGGVAARLGLGARVRLKLQRALADRIQREAEAQEIPSGKAIRWGAKQFKLDPKTLKAWAQHPSFENTETLTYQEQRLREAVKRVHDVLHERFPQPMTLGDLMDVARGSWPKPLVDPLLLEKACKRLVGLHQVATRSIAQPFGALPLCGYKALKTGGTVGETEGLNTEELLTNLRRFREMLSSAGQEHPPQFFAHQVILRRADVPEFLKMVETLNITSLQRYGARQSGPPNELSTQLAPGESLMVLQCTMDQIGIKRPHSRYT